MELPVAIQQALNAVEETGADSNTAPVFEVINESGLDSAVRMVLLQDTEGQLQVICRYYDLLDMAALNRELGRDLRVLDRRAQNRLKDKLGVEALPALPSLTGWTTLVDAAVDKEQSVTLLMGANSHRVKLSGQAFQAITAGAQRVNVTKPSQDIAVNLNQPEQDRAQVNAALERFTSLRIRQRLDDTLELPPLSETVQRIIHLRVNPNANMGELVDVVENDPSLAAQVVSWASSSFYAAAGQVKSVHDAVFRVLGFDLVMNLAMGLALGRALKPPEDEPDGYIGYWQQAIWQAQSVGVLSAMMPRRLRPAFGLAYLGGLLHNFGYLVLNQVFPPHFRLVCRDLEANPHLDSSLIEHHVLGITREQLGAQLMENWDMPEELVVALRHQKNPGYDGDHAVYPQLLWLGRQLLIEHGVSLGEEPDSSLALMILLGLEPEAVHSQFEEMLEKRDSIMAMAGMMQS
jgi:HD-like signal output (HDOD) protein/prolyl-tRNA editing enzyme YbaK/EbsC (Cys-tRNA(Pro) deacylase)